MFPNLSSPSFRSLPSVDRLLAHPRMEALARRYGRETVADVARAQLAIARERIASGSPAPSADDLSLAVESAAAALYAPSLRPVINATGVVIHTNLGRAPLSAEATEAMRAAALGYTNLELDLSTGERGSRHTHLENLLTRLTGADGGIAVNNGAAAVMLGLNAFAFGKDVLVSRGEAVEIGGGFRIPDILKNSGARLVEVGTTNRTYVRDYEAAFSRNTGAILTVHRSNFRVVGFTDSPTLEELVQFAAKKKVPLLHDLGSGCLLETRDFALAHEPMVQESVKAKADLIFFSGDKLLGGPQAGLIVGKAKYMKVLKAHPLVRALRIDKMTTAALQATLLHYIRGEASAKVPVWRMIATPIAELEQRAGRWAGAIGEGARVVDAQSTIGGGSLPGETLPTRALAIAGSGTALKDHAARLRAAPTPIMARIEKGMLLLDPRTVHPDDDPMLLGSLKVALGARQV
ncbi:MAG: L-seryl-tRNA(Sec) selenium transferase [Chloroflexi bacterium]|nr:L-seryl-tRNA(Sec) selenium transferase [Chloroflexota bacterium]